MPFNFSASRSSTLNGGWSLSTSVVSMTSLQLDHNLQLSYSQSLLSLEHHRVMC